MVVPKLIHPLPPAITSPETSPERHIDDTWMQVYITHILILLFIRLEIGGAEHLFSGVKCKSTTYTNKRTPTNPRRPWLSCLDINLSRETETHLWDCILLLMSCLFDDDPHVVYRSNQNHSWSIARWITSEMDHTWNQCKRS